MSASGGTIYGGQGVTVRAVRRTHPSRVACPSCGAGTGEPCLTAAGTAYAGGNSHGTRKRMAVRLANTTAASVDVALMRWVGTIAPVERKRLRRALRLTQGDLAERLHFKASTLRLWETGRLLPSGPEGTRYALWLKDVAGAPSVPIEAPPVNVRLGTSAPQDAERAEPDLSRMDGGSLCNSCGKWLPGERSLCGRCFGLGSTS